MCFKRQHVRAIGQTWQATAQGAGVIGFWVATLVGCGGDTARAPAAHDPMKYGRDVLGHDPYLPACDDAGDECEASATPDGGTTATSADDANLPVDDAPTSRAAASADPPAPPPLSMGSSAMPSTTAGASTAGASTAGASDPSTLHATIVRFLYPGDGCGAPSARNENFYGSSATIGFSFVEPLTQCSVGVELELPAGYRLSVPAITWHGWQDGPITIERSYAWQGATDTWPAMDDVADGSFTLADQPMLAAPPCAEDGSSTHLTLLATLTAQAPGTVLDDFNFGTDWSEGVGWQDCDGNPVRSAPHGAGASCGGKQDVQCTAGLTCDAEPSGDGTCVDPSERTEPAGVHEVCGGVREIACQAGLTCWLPDQASVDAHKLGRCTASQGAAGATCLLGVPKLPCASGLFCGLGQLTCVQADGQADSPCGDGLPMCDPGLTCEGGTGFTGAREGKCTAPPQSCSSSSSCPEGLFCWPGDSVCKHADGKLQSPCSGDLPPCATGFECSEQSLTCVVATDGGVP